MEEEEGEAAAEAEEEVPGVVRLFVGGLAPGVGRRELAPRLEAFGAVVGFEAPAPRPEAAAEAEAEAEAEVQEVRRRSMPFHFISLHCIAGLALPLPLPPSPRDAVIARD